MTTGEKAGYVNCDEAVRKLYEFLDGELTDVRRQEIAEHLDRCGPCVDVFGFESELRHVIARKCQDRVPDELVARVAHAIREEAERADA